MFSIKALISLAACLGPALAHPTTNTRAVVPTRDFACGTEPTAEFLAVAAEMMIAEANGTLSAASDFSAQATISVNTYVHVVASSTSSSGGYITSTQISNQIAYMNSAYASSGFAFVLAGTDYTVSTSWANDGAELAMKKALRKGTYKDLNLYFQLNVGGAGSGLLGVWKLLILLKVELLLINLDSTATSPLAPPAPLTISIMMVVPLLPRVFQVEPSPTTICML
jgi:hypothetical protein